MSKTEPEIESFRREPPAPLAPRPLNIAAAEELTLSNGLRVLLVENKRLPLITLRLAFPTGDSHDPPERPGLTDIVAGMLNEGTQSRTSRQIADEVALIGATLTAGANSDYTTVAATALTAYAGQIFELMADVALHPSFPEEELELTKQNTLQNLIAQRGQASFLASERVSRVIYGAHPYHVVAPTPESVNAATREEVAAFHRASFIPNDAILVVGGDFERDEIMRRAEELFGSWSRGQAREVEFPAPPRRESRATYLVDRPGSAQSNIIIANLAIKRTDPDYFSALLMHTILGANASSRLFMNLREEKGYTYGAYTNLDARRAAGSFRATAEVRTPVTGDSLREFFHEFARIRDEMVTEEELYNAKNYLTGIFPIRLETLDGLIDQLVQIRMFKLPTDYLQTYRDHVQAITREDVQRAAQNYVTPDRAAIVIVGDAAALNSQIAPYADEVELYDNTGQRKEQGASVSNKSNDTTLAGASMGQTTSTSSAPQTVGAGAATASDASQTSNASAADASTATANVAGDQLFGTWALDVKTPFGQHPATLKLARGANGEPTGAIKSQLGDGALSEINLDPNDLRAVVSLTLQGRAYDARVAAIISDGQMSGTIKVNNLPIPAPALKFTGRKQQ
ncbi:MAG: zinc protease [Acidobacteriota bacterium]|nr:zinc protease [Acidobacteriota bacterium]